MTLHPATYKEALARRQASDARRQHTPMKRGSGLQRSRVNKRGPKVRSWEEERAKLKRRFLAVGVITCELRYAGCAFDNYLGFAHADKRRNLSREDLSVVILACNFCHDMIEVDPRMKEIVMAVIAARAVQP